MSLIRTAGQGTLAQLLSPITRWVNIRLPIQNPLRAGGVLLNEYRSPLTLANTTWIWSKCIWVQPAAGSKGSSSVQQHPWPSSVLAADSCDGNGFSFAPSGQPLGPVFEACDGVPAAIQVFCGDLLWNLWVECRGLQQPGNERRAAFSYSCWTSHSQQAWGSFPATRGASRTGGAADRRGSWSPLQLSRDGLICTARLARHPILPASQYPTRPVLLHSCRYLVQTLRNYLLYTESSTALFSS